MRKLNSSNLDPGIADICERRTGAVGSVGETNELVLTCGKIRRVSIVVNSFGVHSPLKKPSN